MQAFFSALLPFLIVGYMVTLGLCLIIYREQGFAKANSLWFGAIRLAVLGLRKFLNWALGEIARLLK